MRARHLYVVRGGSYGRSVLHGRRCHGDERRHAAQYLCRVERRRRLLPSYYWDLLFIQHN